MRHPPRRLAEDAWGGGTLSVTTYPPIGLAGNAGVGKDTVADILHRRYGYRRFGLSDAVREHLYAALPPDIRRSPEAFAALLEHDKRRPADDSHGWARPLLQSWATAHRELGGATYWLVRVPVSAYCAITGVRYHSDVAYLRERGALIWRISRPGYGPLPHPSEQEIATIAPDAELNNGGSLDDLTAAVDVLMSALLVLPQQR